MTEKSKLPYDVAKEIKQDRWTPAELSYTFGGLNTEGLLRYIAAQNEVIIDLMKQIDHNTKKKPVGRPRKEED